MKQDLIETDKAFSDMSVKQGTAKAFDYYLVDDALQLPPGGPPIYGKDNIVGKMEKSSDPDEILSWEPKDGSISRSGDLGYTWGVFKVLIKGRTVAEGKYLNIWTKHNDGSWRVKVDMGDLNAK